MMITMLFFSNLEKTFKIKKIMQKLRHQVLEAEAIQKLLLPYSWFKQYFPELKEKEAAVVRNPFSTAEDVSDILDELQDKFYDLQNDSFARDGFREIGTFSVLVCYAQILPTSIQTGFSNITSICHNIPLRERLSALVHIKRKARKIEDDLRLVLSNTKPRIPKIGFAVAKSTVALTVVKLSSYLKLNIFEVFFVIIFICAKSRAERGSLAVWNF